VEAKAIAKSATRAKAEKKAKAKAKAKIKAEAQRDRVEIAKAKAQANRAKAEAAKAEAEAKRLRAEAEKLKAVAIENATKERQAADAAIQAAPATGAGALLAMCAKDIMQKDVLWDSPDDSVQAALTKMQQYSASYMMIGRDKIPTAIVSKSDLTSLISPYLRPTFAKWRRPLDDATLKIKIKCAMTSPVHTISPQASLADIMENMSDFGTRCLPVTDQKGKVQGLVTVSDIFKALVSCG
jgi:CBS domain-containing protein